MKDIELLAPAGSFDALKAGVKSGANAVYLSGQLYGARAFAHNFDYLQLKEAVQYCHLRNVKVYVTVNTLYSDDQFDELYEYLNYLNSIQVDALIIQDMGLFDIVHDHFPDMELHVSTQASVHSLSGVKYFEKKGAHRVVLARENSIQDIDDICHHTNVDIEVFVHGALCISCSGQCLMSSFIGQRSGNKGACGQPCRLPYQLKEDQKILSKQDYLLSPKDLCTLDNVEKLIKAGVKSFKIEGRMKSPEYVASVVSSYRQAIDQTLNFDEIEIKKEYMKSFFNRGYTKGLLFSDKNMITHTYSGNIGIPVGKVKYFDRRKNEIHLQIDQTLSQGDRVKFGNYDFLRTITKLFHQGKLIHTIENDDVVIELDQYIKEGTIVYKIYDSSLHQSIGHSLTQSHRRVDIEMIFEGQINQYPILTIKYKEFSVTVKGKQLILPATNKPTDQETIVKQLTKLGNTSFQCDQCFVNIDHQIFLPVSLIKSLRREAIQQLEDKILAPRREEEHHLKINDNHYDHSIGHLDIQIHDINVIDELNLTDIHRIYIPYHTYYSTKEKHPELDLIPFIEFWPNEKQVQLFREYNNYKDIHKIMVSNFGMKNLFSDKEVILSSQFNLCNSYAFHHFDEREAVLSLEMSKSQINGLKSDKQLTFMAYGKIKNMNLRHCIISDYYFKEKREHCQLCKKHKYQLIDRKGEKFDLITDENCNNYLLNSHVFMINQLNHLSVDRILLSFTNESVNEINHIISLYTSTEKPKNTINKQITRGYF